MWLVSKALKQDGFVEILVVDNGSWNVGWKTDKY